MGLVVKLDRVGSIRKPSYKVVVTEKRKSGVVDDLGYIRYTYGYPSNRTYACIDMDKLAFWVSNGAVVIGRLKRVLVEIR